MSLNDEERRTIVSLELEKAHNTFEEIEILVNASRWSGAASRLYYAVFHAVNALLINDAHIVNTHKGSHAIFIFYYIKTGIIATEYGRLYNTLQTLREKSDYNCVYVVTREEIYEAIEPARNLLSIIESYIVNSHHTDR